MKKKIATIFCILLIFSKIACAKNDKDHFDYSVNLRKSNIMHRPIDIHDIQWNLCQPILHHTSYQKTILTPLFYSFSSIFPPNNTSGVEIAFFHNYLNIYTHYGYKYNDSLHQTKNVIESNAQLSLSLFNQIHIASNCPQIYLQKIAMDGEKHWILYQVMTLNNYAFFVENNKNLWKLNPWQVKKDSWCVYRSWNIGIQTSFLETWFDHHKYRSEEFHQNNPPGLIIQKMKKDIETVKTIIELFLGLHGEWWFNQERYHFVLQGRVDEQLWIHFGELLFFFSQRAEDFSMSGLTLNARLDF